jgi:PPE-repeat protein
MCLVVALALWSSRAVLAQSWMGAGGTPAFGGNAFGGGGFGTSGFGNAGFGASRFGSSGFGSRGLGLSGFGNAGFGASRFGSGGFGGGFGGGGLGFGAGGSGFGGSVFGSRGFGMGGYGGGPAFVGRDSADMAAAFSETGRAGNQFVGQMNRNINRPSRARPAAQPVENAPLPLRVELEVAFDAPRPTPVAITNRLRTRLGKILADHGIAQPEVTMEGDTAVLRGVAATESQRLVLEKLVALEPGVRQVRNEMLVSEPAVTPVLPAD